MEINNEKTILEAIKNLETKVDNLASQMQNTNAARLDSETVAVITAAAYNTFGKAVAIRNVRLVNSITNK